MNINFQKISFIAFFSIAFFIKSSLNWEISSIHANLFTESFCDIAQPYKLFKSKYLRYGDYLFLFQSFIFLLLVFAYRWIAWHIPSPIPFSIINSISISVKNSSFTLAFLKLLTMLIQALKETLQDLNVKFLNTIS